jgi:CRP-like cAMP-binding protein
MPGAHIIRAGDVCTAVYFIKKGEVVILDEKANMELCVDVLYENECFGEVKVLLPIKEQFQFSYVARLETEMGVLYGDDMVDVLGRHPGVLEEVVGRADKLKAQRLAKKEEQDRIGKDEGSSAQNSSQVLRSSDSSAILSPSSSARKK